MKFCVFGVTNYKDSYNISARKNLSNNPWDFYESLHSYEYQISTKKFKKVFFLVDFGTEKDWPYWFRGVAYDEHAHAPIPWLMIADYDIIELDNCNAAIPDYLTLRLKGFKEGFENPTEAFKRYQYFIQNKLKCSMYVDIDSKERIFVTNTPTDIVQNNSMIEKIYCRRYKIKG